MIMQDVGIVILYLLTMGMVMLMVVIGLGIAYTVGYVFDRMLTKWGFWSYNKTECTMFGFTLDVISMLIGLVIGIAGCYTVSDLVYDLNKRSRP